MEQKITHWLDHSKASEVCGFEYALVQGFVDNTKENWKVVDDLRAAIDMDIQNQK